MIGYHTRLGIDLARQGRKPEALAYLRRAVMTEPVNAEVWLWLAHVSPDLQEYRNCVHQALILEPDHPTALQMQQDLDYQAYGVPPPMMAMEAARTMAKPHHQQARWRRILILLNAIVLVIACGLVVNLLSNRLDVDELREVLVPDESDKGISFGVGPEAEAVNFQVDVPVSWFLADKGSPSWREQRDRLGEEFPAVAGEKTIWQELETDLGEVRRNNFSGDFLQTVAIVETDSALISENPDFVARAVLVAIKNMPVNNNCQNLRDLANQEQSASSEVEGFVEVEVRQREDDCIYYSHYRNTLETGAKVYFFQLNVPVSTNQLAIWHVTVPESLYEDHYKTAIDTLINSLRYVEPT